MARVLVVEDEDTTRLLIESRLRGAGHRVRAASSVADAHAVVERAGPPEVLVTDMFMPGGSGLALVASLREDLVGAQLPVVLVSGRALPADVEAGRSLGAAFLLKPVTTAALVEAVDAALEVAPTALEAAVRERLDDLGDVGDPEERELFASLLTSFVDAAPAALAAVERALAAGDAAALEAGAHRLAGAASNLGAAPLARLCQDLESRAGAGTPPAPGAVQAVRAVLRGEVALTCRVLTALARELAAAQGEGYL